MEEKRNDGIFRRLIESPVVRRISGEDRVVEFVASDNTVDSYGTIIPVDKWDLTRYQKNGAVGYMHDVYGDSWSIKADPDDIIGKGVAFVEDEQLIVRIEFEPPELNAKADKIFRKIQFGSLNAVSVGFMPTKEGHWGDKTRGENEDVYYYDGQELLEVSVVNIPSNANAVRRSLGLVEEQARVAKPSAPAADPAPKVDDSNEKLRLAKAKALSAMV